MVGFIIDVRRDKQINFINFRCNQENIKKLRPNFVK